MTRPWADHETGRGEASLSGTALFAMKSEAAPVLRALSRARGGAAGVTVTTVGMGPRNADAGIRRALDLARPELVLTCGLAGGLVAELAVGQIVFETTDPSLSKRIADLGAKPLRFHCSDRIACFAADKARLRASTGADAVEMESGVIQAVCKERAIPCATVRVISDAADDDLPMDFNALATDDGNLSIPKLAWELARSPAKVRALLTLRTAMVQVSAGLSTFLVERLLPELQASSTSSSPTRAGAGLNRP